MGTTLDMLQAGSSQYVLVCAIEGYKYLLHSHSSSSAVLTAWTGTDWSSALPGLSADIRFDQAMDPSEPFGQMGTCTLWVQKIGTDDTFGIDTHRRSGGVETYLSQTLDRDATTVNVLSTSLFAGSGEIHIGTECISYTGTSGTTSFTTCTRGKYSPFGSTVDGSAGDRHGRDHTVRTDSNSVNLQPIVSSIPRAWKGRFVGVWAHRVVAGVLDTKAQAELIYAGTIGDIRDDPGTGCTVVEVRSIMEWVGQRVLGDGLFEAKVSDGILITTDMAFSAHETGTAGSSTIDNSTNQLLVVASGATGANEMNAGRYTGDELATILNTWLTSETAATRLGGTYSVSFGVDTSRGVRTQLSYSLALDNGGRFRFELPGRVAKFFGWSKVDDTPATPGHVKLDVTVMGVGQTYSDPDTEPLRVVASLNGTANATVDIESNSGELIDQYSYLPTSIRPISNQIGGVTYSWGLFVIGDSQPMLAAFDTADPTYLTGLVPWIGGTKTRLGTAIVTRYPTIEVAASEAPPRVRQIFAIEQEFKTLVIMALLSTGTAGYNSIFDMLPKPISVGLPSTLAASGMLDELPGSTETGVYVIEKATRFSDIIKSDLVMRWGFLAWTNGTLKFRSWRSPSAQESTLDLDDTSKAEPAGAIASHVSASTQTDQWMRSIVKVEFDRTFAELGSEKYKSSVSFYDRVAVEDQGGAVAVHTYKLANTFEEFTETGTGVETLLPQYLAKMPMLSRPAWIVDRSISPELFWQLTIGDVVTFSDPHARDPSTGQRGVVDRPALIVSMAFSPGGTIPARSGPPTQLPMGGSMRLFFTDVDTDRSGALYAPSANVDYSAQENPELGFDPNDGYSRGYNSSTLTLRCEDHAYSNDDEVSDGTKFQAGDEIIILERDPVDPTSPISWRRTVDSVETTDITLTSALSSPAWDSTKRYVVLYADFADVQSTQLANVFQGDDATGLLDGSSQPFQYGSGNADTADENDEVGPELPANRIYADGAGRCVYGDTQIIRLVDAFIDYNAQQRDSFIFPTVLSNIDATTSTGYKLVGYWPVFLNYEQLSNSVYRYITCAPWAGSTDGTSTKVRIRLRSTRPTDSTLYDISPIGDYASAEWTGITSTTLTTLSAATTLTVNVKNSIFAGNSAGLAYVTLELGYKASTRGIAHWAVGIRQAI